MIDTSKYIWTEKKSDESDGMLSQEFYDENAHVKYARIAFPESLKDEEIDIMTGLFRSAFSLTERIVPNCMKCKIGPRSIEVLYFSDEDIDFRTKTELDPKLRSIVGEKLMVTYEDMENGYKNFNAKIDKLVANSELVELFKDVYKKYLDKEL